MLRRALSIFCLLTCFLFAISSAVAVRPTQEYVAIEKALQSISKIVVKYKSEFDTRVQFSELNDAIHEIDKSMLDYLGVAKEKLSPLRRLNSEARLIYQDCVGPVFEWCVSINSTFDIFITYINDVSLTKHDKDIIWDMTTEALADGKNKTTKSLSLLVEVQKKTLEIKNLLDAMQDDLRDDFGPNGVYGKQREDLQNAIVESGKRRKAFIIAGVIGLIFSAVVAFVAGPIGVALALAPMFVRLGLEAVLENRRKATYEEQLRAIQEFFNVLDEKIKHASDVAGKVNDDLEEDKRNLYALQGFINSAKNNGKLLLMDSLNLRGRLADSFRNLGHQCYEYTMWHGYGSEGYNHKKHARTRRQASESCKERRLKALSTMVPSNGTFSVMVSKAHFILNNMDCESIVSPPRPLLDTKNDQHLIEDLPAEMPSSSSTKETFHLMEYWMSKHVI